MPLSPWSGQVGPGAAASWAGQLQQPPPSNHIDPWVLSVCYWHCVCHQDGLDITRLYMLEGQFGVKRKSCFLLVLTFGVGVG